MKEKVDRILNGESVDIIGDGTNYYLSVLKQNAEYKMIGFISPKNIGGYGFHYDTTKTIREAGNLLIELAEELEIRKKFKDGEKFFRVDKTGSILEDRFYGTTRDYRFLLVGNAFKTHEEAEEHKDEIMAKYQDLKDRGIV